MVLTMLVPMRSCMGVRLEIYGPDHVCAHAVLHGSAARVTWFSQCVVLMLSCIGRQLSIHGPDHVVCPCGLAWENSNAAACSVVVTSAAICRSMPLCPWCIVQARASRAILE